MSDSLPSKQSVAEFFGSPKMAQKVLSTLTKKPKRWGFNSNSSYYNEAVGVWLKPYVDHMIETKEDLLFPFASTRLSPTTVYLRVQQGLTYLVEQMDDEKHTYATFKSSTRCKKEHGVGVRLYYLDRTNDNPVAVMPQEIRHSWKDRVDWYLENAAVGDEPLHLDMLCLTPEQIADLRTSMTGLSGVIFNVSSSEIKIIKVQG